MTDYTQDEKVIHAYRQKSPVHRLLVNTSAGIGSIGATTNLFPSLTLGCGAVGNGSTSDNVGPKHLMNIRRVAHGIKDFDDLNAPELNENNESDESFNDKDELVRKVVKQVMKQLQDK